MGLVANTAGQDGPMVAGARRMQDSPGNPLPTLLTALRLFAAGVLGASLLAGCKSLMSPFTVTEAPASTEAPTNTTSATSDPPAADAPLNDVLAVQEITTFLDNARQDLIERRASAETDAPDAAAFEGTPESIAPDGSDPLVIVTAEPASDSATSAVETVQPASADPQLSKDEPDSDDGSFQPDPLKAYIRNLLDVASTSDAPLRQHLTLAILLAMTDPDQAFKPEGLAELTDAEQDLIRIVHERFRDLGEELEQGGDTASFISFMTELIDQVEAEQPFRISRLDLCTKVQDYGVVESVDPPIFDPTERPGFIWYLELDGFEPAQDSKDDTWVYEFDLRLEMLTRDTGIPVIAPIEGTVRHKATSEVRDFYLRDLFRMPSDLQFDWYTAKITVVERRTGAQAQKSADLLWVPNLAAGEAHLQRQAVVSP